MAAGLLARARLADRNGDATALDADADDPASAAFAAWDDGDRERALDLLQAAIRAAPPEDRDQLRRVMVAIFTELGPDSPVARDHRRRLAAALN